MTIDSCCLQTYISVLKFLAKVLANKTENTSSLNTRAKALNIESNRAKKCLLFRALFLQKSEKWKIDRVYQ